MRSCEISPRIHDGSSIGGSEAAELQGNEPPRSPGSSAALVERPRIIGDAALEILRVQHAKQILRLEQEVRRLQGQMQNLVEKSQFQEQMHHLELKEAQLRHQEDSRLLLEEIGKLRGLQRQKAIQQEEFEIAGLQESDKDEPEKSEPADTTADLASGAGGTVCASAASPRI